MPMPDENRRIVLESNFALALGFYATRQSINDILQRIVTITGLPAGVAWECRQPTKVLLIQLVNDIQMATWDKRVDARARAETMVGEHLPKDWPTVVGIALDIGLAQARLPAGTLVEALRALRTPVRRRLEGVVVDLLRHVADDCEIEVL